MINIINKYFDSILTKEEKFVLFSFLFSSMKYLNDGKENKKVSKRLSNKMNSLLIGRKVDFSSSDKLFLMQNDVDNKKVVVVYLVICMTIFANKKFTVLVNDVNTISNLLEEYWIESNRILGPPVIIKDQHKKWVKYIFRNALYGVNTIKFVDYKSSYNFSTDSETVLSIDLMINEMSQLNIFLDTCKNVKPKLHLSITCVDLMSDAIRQFLINSFHDVGFSGLAEKFIDTSNNLETIIVNINSCTEEVEHRDVCSTISPCYWSFNTTNKKLHIDEFKAFLTETKIKLNI